jgi:hypothetical protein
MPALTVPYIAMDDRDGKREERHRGEVLVVANEKICSGSRDSHIGTQSLKKIIPHPLILLTT